MIIEDLLKQCENFEYNIAVTRDGINWNVIGGKWYISPAKLIGADSNSSYPTDWSDYKGIKVIKRKSTSSIDDFDVLSHINKKKK